MQTGQSSYSIFKMGVDRGHYKIVAYSNVGFELGTQICTAADLSSNQFTYEGFSFVSTDGGNTWLADPSIPYAVTPPIYLKEGNNSKLFCVDDTEKLILVRHPDSSTYCLEKNTDTGVLTLAYPSQAGIESGEVIANLTGSKGTTFNWESYVFTEGPSASYLTSVPVVTDI